MKRILVYRQTVLPPSETFIRQQINCLQNWDALLVGQSHTLNGINLDGLKTVILDNFLRCFCHKLAWRFFALTGWSNLPIYKKLLKFDASVIHVHFAIDAAYAWSWLRHFKIPLVVTLHGYDITTNPEWWSSGNGGKYLTSFPNRLKALANNPNVTFIAVSQAIRQAAIKIYGISPDKIKVIYIGIDTKLFPPNKTLVSKRLPKVLFVGRLVEKKGVEFLIKAMVSVQNQIPNAELIIIGDGPLRAEMNQLANRLKITAHFRGVMSSSDIQEQMQEVRVFCLPSVIAQNGDSEGFGMVLLEAQASGLPVITSAVGGRDEGILEGKTGFSFKEGDVLSLSQHILNLLNNNKLTDEMSAAGPKFISDNFNIDQCTKTLELYYDFLANGHTK